MLKNILLILSAIVLITCAPHRKSSPQKVGLRGFSAYYNTLYNSKDALETELNGRRNAFRDNFYAPYIPLLTTAAEVKDLQASQSAAGINGPDGAPHGATAVTVLDIAAAKAIKALAKYSVMKNGEEKNKRMFEASMLLAQSRLYQNKPLEALDALNYVFSFMPRDRRLNMAKIYQAQAFTKLGDYYRADEIFRNLKDLSAAEEKLKTVWYSELLLASGKKEEAAAELEEAYKVNKDHDLRGRIAFLRGQILASLGQNEKARESFTTAYQQSTDFEFEVKSQVEIAKTFRKASDDYESAKSYLEQVLKKGIYASRKNEFYYALGLLARQAGNDGDAQSYFHRALKEKMSDPQLRGLTYYEIGKDYFTQDDYLSAGAYYDSAVAVMNYEPSKAELSTMAANIKKLTDNYYLIKKNDSILRLTQMPAPEREAYFKSYIEKLQAKENAALASSKSKQETLNAGDYNANSMFAGQNNTFSDFATTGTKGFYFTSQSAVAKGQSTFRQLWGERSPQDNWRYSARMNTISDMKNQTLGLTALQDPRRFETSFYISKIPTDAAEISSLKKSRDTASLGLAGMYEAYFGNTPLATKTLYDLIDQQPESDIKLQALYQIFSLNYQNNPASAQRAKSMILSEFPGTPYAEFVKNPKSTAFIQAGSEAEESYRKAFAMYNAGEFAGAKTLINNTLAKHQQDVLTPKFYLLSAYITGKSAGREAMISELTQLQLNYPKTPEGGKAAEILKYLTTADSIGAMVPAAAPAPAATAQPLPDATVQQQAAVNQPAEINTTQNVVKPANSASAPLQAPGNMGNGTPADVPVTPGMPDRQEDSRRTSPTPLEKKNNNEKTN